MNININVLSLLNVTPCICNVVKLVCFYDQHTPKTLKNKKMQHFPKKTLHVLATKTH